MKTLLVLIALLFGFSSCDMGMGSGTNPTIKYWLEVQSPDDMSRLFIIRSTSEWAPANISWSIPATDVLPVADSLRDKPSRLAVFTTPGEKIVSTSFMTPAGDAFHTLDTVVTVR